MQRVPLPASGSDLRVTKRDFVCVPVAASVRAAMWRELQLQCSVGVACNKTLAKLVRLQHACPGVGVVARRRWARARLWACGRITGCG